MSKKGRQLLQEILGEEKFQSYENGDWIGVKSPDGYEYFAKKGRFYIPIKRVPIEKDEKHHEKNNESSGNNEEESEHPLLNDRFFLNITPRIIWSSDIKREQMGKLNGNDLYDAVATYVQSAKLGKVNWGCGNIDIDLPVEMPPKDMSFSTFVERGLVRLWTLFIRFPRIYHKFIVETGMHWLFIAGLTSTVPLLLLYMAVDLIFLNGCHQEGLIYLSFIYPFIAFHSGYLRWKNKWEVNME